MHQRRHFLRLFIILISTLACAMPSLGGTETPVVATINEGGPTVTLSSPTIEETLIAGQEIKVLSTAIDPTAGISRVELIVGGQVIWSDANPDPQPNTPYIVAQPWTPPAPGSYALQVRAYNTDPRAGQSEQRVVQVVAAAPIGGETPPVAPTDSPSTTGDSLPPSTPPPTPATPTVSPAPSATPTELPTATPTLRPFEPTGLEPAGRFREVWLNLGGSDSRLGYPTEAAIEGRDFARQYFEQGVMYWWDSPEETDYVWVLVTSAPNLDRGDHWSRHVDTWAGDDPHSCEAALSNGEMGPLRGFGQVWCDQPEVRQRLRAPRELERGSGGTPPFGRVQFYQGGVILDNPINREIYVLFDQGDWLRFGY